MEVVGGLWVGIGMEQNNTHQLKLFFWHENCGRHWFGRFVGVLYIRNKLALRTKVRNLNLRSLWCITETFYLDCFSFIYVVTFSWCPMRSVEVLTLSAKKSLKCDPAPKYIRKGQS